MSQESLQPSENESDDYPDKQQERLGYHLSPVHEKSEAGHGDSEYRQTQNSDCCPPRSGTHLTCVLLNTRFLLSIFHIVVIV